MILSARLLTCSNRPVQTAILPFLLTTLSTGSEIYKPYDPLRDVLASAPTGSGKTLAYIIPIVEARAIFSNVFQYINQLNSHQILASRIVTRLRALVVLPTRDLVQQVKEAFEACYKGTKLKVVVPWLLHQSTQRICSSPQRPANIPSCTNKVK